jgi:hypothetical protein
MGKNARRTPHRRASLNFRVATVLAEQKFR